MENMYGNAALISIISSLKNQVDVMENFLSWLCPDYTRIKHFWGYQHRSHSASFTSQPLQSNACGSSNIPLETLFASLPPNVLQELKNKINMDAKIAPASRRAPKRRFLQHSNAPPPTTKPRGRKRKLSNVPAYKNIEPVLTPAPTYPPLYFESQRTTRSNDLCLPTNANTTTNAQKKPHLEDNSSQSSYTSLDMLAAVSSAFQTQESSNAFVTTTEKNSNDSPLHDYSHQLPVQQVNGTNDTNVASNEVYFTSTDSGNCDFLPMDHDFVDLLPSEKVSSEIIEPSLYGNLLMESSPVMGLDSYSPSLSPIYTSLGEELDEECHIFTSVPAQEIIV